MYSNHRSLKNIQSMQLNEELKKMRVMLFSAIISYPLWGLLSKHMAPSAYDPIWQRLVLSFIAALVLISTYVWKNSLKNISKYYYIEWLFSYHLLFLYWKNPDTAYYIICNLIQFPYLILAFPNKKMAEVYTYTKMGAVFLFSIFVKYKIINPWFFVLSIFTLGHYLLTILKQHFNVLENIQQVEDEFDMALSNMLEGVIIMNSKGELTDYNKTAEALLGFHKESHIGKSFRETSFYKNSIKEDLTIYTDEDHPIVNSVNLHIPIKNEVVGVLLENGRRLWLQLNIQPLIYKSNKYILVSFSDLSMVRKAQEEKVKKQAQMEMTARLSSMFAVAGGIAHEINNPLGIIVARLNSLLKKIESDHYDKDYFQKSIQKTIIASYRISTIVASLLALSKSADDLPMETVSLSEVLIDTFQLCRENLKHNNIDLIFDDIPDVLIKCRAIQIAQVLINLINNSIDAVANQKDKWIHFSFIEESDDILISVCDSGPRIPESIRLRMMEPFFTTKEVGKGAGLGLSVSKAIIEEHEGSLYLSNDSHKTCIIIQLKKEL